MSRVLAVWCRLYTAAAPVEHRDRRRLEIESHLWEASSAGVGGLRLMAGALLGALEDVRWCREERDLAALPPVSVTATGSAVVAGALVAVAFLLSFSPALHYSRLVQAPAVLAVGIVVVSWVDRALRARRARFEQ